MKQTTLSPKITRQTIPSGSAVVCALSGGSDSVCLLHLLSRREDITLTAAHFNHCLRGEGSDEDEQFVRDLCRTLHIPLTVGRGDVSGFARSENRSVEEAARLLRYRFLRDTAEGALIATAHNAEDQAETVLWNLIRGTGLTGLAGIPPRRDNIVRPLLTVSRRDISAYLRQHDLPHREDPTNAEEIYTRNRLRHQVLPLLRELNPKAVEHIGQTAQHLRELDGDLTDELAPLLSDLPVEGGQLTFPLARLDNTPPSLRPKLLLLLTERLGACRQNIGAVHLDAVLSLPPGGTAHLPNGLTVRRVYDTLVLSVTTAEPPPPLSPLPLHRGENPVPNTPWRVLLSGEPWTGLTVRARQTGDTLTLPNGHTRSLKRLLIDRKIPRWERDTLPVVADQDGILAVAGIGENTAHPKRSQIKIIQTERGDRV